MARKGPVRTKFPAHSTSHARPKTASRSQARARQGSASLSGLSVRSRFRVVSNSSTPGSLLKVNGSLTST
ncbi:hypothetical protein H0H93_001330 [Arthromyces matolae]|nr:hypothetical protein H0H93_001330 [Arthromyces matolae]